MSKARRCATTTSAALLLCFCIYSTGQGRAFAPSVLHRSSVPLSQVSKKLGRPICATRSTSRPESAGAVSPLDAETHHQTATPPVKKVTTFGWMRRRSPALDLVVLSLYFALHVKFLSLRAWTPPLSKWLRLGPSAVGLDLIVATIALTSVAVTHFRCESEHKKRKSLDMLVRRMGVKGRRVGLTAFSAVLSVYFLSSYMSAAAGHFAACIGEVLQVAISPNMVLSLQILAGHFGWVAIGYYILSRALRDYSNIAGASYDVRNLLRCQLRQPGWSLEVIRAFAASQVIFLLGDRASALLVDALFGQRSDTQRSLEDDCLVSQMVARGKNDRFAMLIGSVAPCVGAPWWEEILYRAYALPILATIMPFRCAILATALIFASQHLSAPSMLPLALLGWFWAELYLHSRSLWVVVATHALWNMQLFLSPASNAKS